MILKELSLSELKNNISYFSAIFFITLMCIITGIYLYVSQSLIVNFLVIIFSLALLYILGFSLIADIVIIREFRSRKKQTQNNATLAAIMNEVKTKKFSMAAKEKIKKKVINLETNALVYVVIAVLIILLITSGSLSMSNGWILLLSFFGVFSIFNILLSLTTYFYFLFILETEDLK